MNEEGIMTHEEFEDVKARMKKGESLSLLEAGFMADHPPTCLECRRALERKKEK